MRRREFIALVGSTAAAWPLAAHAQQPSQLPIIGFLSPASSEVYTERLRAFRSGLKEAGYVEGENVAIEYRWAENQIDRLPELAADLVRRQVAVIATPGSTPAALAAKAATSTIPIVFTSGGDPVALGLVASLNRPGGNATGISDMGGELAAKQLGFLHELLPTATHFAMLAHPNNPIPELMFRDAQAAAAAIGGQFEVLTASTNREIDEAFAMFMQAQVDACLVSPDVFLSSRRVRIVMLAAHYKLPAIYYQRDFPEVGGLMSYGINPVDRERLVGAYVGRILKGEKPADLPVQRSTKFEFVINLQTAKLLGLNVPPTLLALADEVIE
jgi:putative tryptophan/tyrosine transport system substrate-binding protein